MISALLGPYGSIANADKQFEAMGMDAIPSKTVLLLMVIIAFLRNHAWPPNWAVPAVKVQTILTCPNSRSPTHLNNLMIILALSKRNAPHRCVVFHRKGHGNDARLLTLSDTRPKLLVAFV